MSIITREIINKNIMFEDRDPMSLNDDKTLYDYNELCVEIDHYKNFLVNKGCRPGESVLIGYSTCVKQIALFFAAAELGLEIIVNDYLRADRFKDWNLVDTKTKLVGPIDYFFHYGDDVNNSKQQFFNKNCRQCFSVEEVDQYKNYEPNLIVNANKNSIVMRCTSSGSTGTPKKVLHTHEFIYNVSKRNTIFFNDVVGLAFNLNHGSSIATYFLPCLMSENVKTFANINLVINDEIQCKDNLDVKLQDVNHLMVPYFYYLETLLTEYEYDSLTYYTLSPVDPRFKENRLGKNYKDIISFFGCNETSGPVFINKISDNNFAPENFKSIDDFYHIKSLNPLIVYLKDYDIDVNTEDKFVSLEDNIVQFNGKKNFIRINGEFVQKEIYNKIVNEFFDDADLIYDTARGKIYLAIWSDKYNDILHKKIKHINQSLLNLTHHRHNLSKIAVLNKKDFVLGVKLDHELLRVYFREKVKYYDQL